MKFVKLFSVLFVLAAVMYIAGCSSAEQTTAKLAFNNKDYEKAEIEFAKETQQNPLNEEAWFYLAVSRAKLGKLDGVKTAITEYRKIGKNTFRNELLQAWGESFDDAFVDYQAASSITNETQQLAKYQSSVNKFEIAYALLPDSVSAKQNIEAISLRMNTIAIKPLIDKGVEYETAGDFASAIGEYNKALEKVQKGSGGYEVAAYNLAVANLKWGEKMRSANSEDPAYKEKYNAALPYLEELANSTNMDNKISAYELLVQVYGSLNMTDKYSEAVKMRDELKSQNNK